MRAAVAGAVVAAAVILGGCEDEPEPGPAAPSPVASAPADAAPEPLPETPVPPLVVVGHATRPQLRLSATEAAALVARRGTPGVAATVRAVQRDPDAVAVVPLDRVGPGVVVAQVDGVDPLRDDPTATTLLVTGDVMLTRGVPDAAGALAPIRRLLRGADLTVGNLESTLSTDGAPQQDPVTDSFGADPALVEVLDDAGFDALSLANNHAGDYGERALVETVRTLRQSRVRPFGAGRDVAEAAAPAVLSAPDGTTYAFVGFNAIGETPMAGRGTPGALSVRMPPRTGPLQQGDLDRVTRVVRRATESADVVVVLPHWGTQYTHAPEPVQRTVARALVGAGADLIVGGHPHWVQGVDLTGGVPVLHSLGNFVFDMDFMTETMEGVVLEATFWGAELRALRLLPYRMDPGTFAPRRVEGRDVLADVWSTSTGPFSG